jgi:hypothetical protein
MAELAGAVYQPPKEGLPLIAVLLDGESRVVLAHAVDSVAEGDSMIGQIIQALHDPGRPEGRS